MAVAQIGTYIRQKRESLRISQEAVAYVLDMSQAAYSKIERNETKIKVDQVYKIADYFGISVYELLPPSLASDVTGENLLSLLYHYINRWLKKDRKTV
ncbi:MULTISPECIES: helix-turn-helix domain-containing protein [Sphingobacterium]|uniref:Transcriptional regulator with XRE-family HTH domain n=2 Tax=Sphingobacterium TaxID=28453 RepID=A0A420AJQ9_SPHD1|nr:MULTISPECIES: helix-turn-helix transcriptional regulator [Sphingobacterium]MCS4228325.1 transcriptional regulator with XRE-family HTH domain [Sphingobacterium sp. BIGb0165]RKE44546.1 transcriptional regulator with XRE-family HTH domain [Sphingobacterium detergens]